MTEDLVNCRADHDYPGRPLAFTWQGIRFEVADVLVQYRTPQGCQFHVRTMDANIFGLDYDITTDTWSVHQL